MADFLKWYLSFKIKSITKFILQITHTELSEKEEENLVNNDRELTLSEAMMPLSLVKLVRVLDLQSTRLCHNKTRLVDVQGQKCPRIHFYFGKSAWYPESDSPELNSGYATYSLCDRMQVTCPLCVPVSSFVRWG